MKLFRRSARIVVDTIEIVSDPKGLGRGSALDIAFSVERSLKPEPNHAQIQIWNLNKEHRSHLEELAPSVASTTPGKGGKKSTGKIAVSIEAGYEEQTAQLFLGNMRSAYTLRQGPDLITTVETGDGEKQYKNARTNFVVGAGMPNDAVISQLVKTLGLGEGNLKDAAVTLAMQSSKVLFPHGTVVSGQASRELSQAFDAMGLEWSIQNGAVQVLNKRRPLLAVDVVLNSGSGLVGSPTIDNKGLLSCQSLLIPDIFPGRSIQVESVRTSGRFRVEKCKYSGNTATDEWYVDIEAKKL